MSNIKIIQTATNTVENENKTRNPIICLPYDERYKAVEKELLMDYDTYQLYVVSKDDRTKIFNVTQKIIDTIDHLGGDKIDIDIQGIGTVNLQDIILELKQNNSKQPKIVDTGEKISYVLQTNVLDESSISTTNSNVEIKGFKKADSYTYPIKDSDGNIKWVPMYRDEKDNNPSTIINVTNPDNLNQNAVDGYTSRVLKLEPSNHVIYLFASKKQESIGLTDPVKVILPSTTDEYCEVQWMVLATKVAPVLKFPDNIIWKNTTNTTSTNAYHVYSFKTWTCGRIWLGDLVKYNTDEPTDPSAVTKSYLDQNYYTKNEIDDIVSWDDKSNE